MSSLQNGQFQFYVDYYSSNKDNELENYADFTLLLNKHSRS